MKRRLLVVAFQFMSLSSFIFSDSATISKNRNGYTLNVNGNKTFIKGICYSPAPVGKVPWQSSIYSADEAPIFDDAEAMQALGANTVRLYENEANLDDMKQFTSRLANIHSFNIIFPIPFKLDAVDFSSLESREELKQKMIERVETYKDTYGIIMWLIGNEIDYDFYDGKAYWETPAMASEKSSFRRASMRAALVFDFLNEVAKEIHKIDTNHLVGVSLGKLDFFQTAGEKLPDVDFIGLNYYPGKNLSAVWSMQSKLNKPMLITEFGYDAYNTKKQSEDEESQAAYIESQWQDIAKHGGKSGGICLGGCVFEWNDEWWKYNEGDQDVHNTEGTWANGSWSDFLPDTLNVQEEWFGINRTIAATNSGSLDGRSPRKAYDVLKNLWQPETK